MVGRPRELGPAAREVDLTAVPSADKVLSMFTFPGPPGRMGWFTVLGADGLRSCMASALLMVLLLFVIVLLLLFIVGICCLMGEGEDVWTVGIGWEEMPGTDPTWWENPVPGPVTMEKDAVTGSCKISKLLLDKVMTYIPKETSSKWYSTPIWPAFYAIYRSHFLV
jgi:hypothetical protein